MAITIKGIRITSLSVIRQDDGSSDKIEANYQLISSVDKVLAKESLTSKKEYGSGEMFVPSITTMKLLADAVTAYKAEVEMSLGIGE